MAFTKNVFWFLTVCSAHYETFATFPSTLSIWSIHISVRSGIVRSISVTFRNEFKQRRDYSLDSSLTDEVQDRTISQISAEIKARRSERSAKLREVSESEEWKSAIASLRQRFEGSRSEFLSLLENQPGFLQSSFLGLHRKLRQTYRA